MKQFPSNHDTAQVYTAPFEGDRNVLVRHRIAAMMRYEVPADGIGMLGFGGGRGEHVSTHSVKPSCVVDIVSIGYHDPITFEIRPVISLRV